MLEPRSLIELVEQPRVQQRKGGTSSIFGSRPDRGNKSCCSKGCATACINCAIVGSTTVGVVLGLSSASYGHIPNGAPVSLRQIIQDPETMFAHFGFVSGPMVFIFLKGFFNFVVQMALYVGMDMCQGRDAIRKKFEEPQRLSTLSFLFQTIGLTSTTFAYTRITAAAQPWASWRGWEIWSFLISQHMGTITLLVGLCSNLIAAVLIDDAEEIGYDERAVGRCLVVCGLAVGTPVWLSLGSTAWPCILFLGLTTPVCLKVLFRLPCVASFGNPTLREMVRMLLFREHGADGLSAWALLTVSSCVCFSILSVLVGVDRTDTWLLVGTTYVSLLFPLVATSAVLSLVCNTAPPQMLAFWMSMSLVYITIMTIPASILSWDGDIRIGGCAPAAFMGKQARPFFRHTFFLPAEDALETAKATVDDDYVFTRKFLLWLSQVVSFFT
ncbi:unnamed protein product [Prorocentrum cordatum]|uniref:Uncharacterized protein n=1 Tax=Prorocentrum cordatum TaxID=2364126 RepID=A0ABN9VGA3_9DINO|nr:unnamed protein product [Polarella glacialis]